MLGIPTDLSTEAASAVAAAVNRLLADCICAIPQDQEFALANERNTFPRLPPALLDEQDEQIFEMTDVLAERVRKIEPVSLMGRRLPLGQLN
jgi:starvation-inducible DNA-binding protein